MKLHLGGVGLYGSIKDYLILLRHILLIKGKEVIPLFFWFIQLYLFQKVGKTPPNPILSAKTVEEIFTPALPFPAIPSLDFFVSGLGVPAGNQWGNSLALRTEDLPERRKKGSAYCAFILFHWLFTFLSIALMLLGFGWAGTFGHMDPETGIVAFFATQVPPSPDGELFQVYEECERILYSYLEKDWL